MVGPKRPGPAPLPVAEKMTAITLVKGTPEVLAYMPDRIGKRPA